ncbi:MAG: integrase [Lautropia sp.]|nr:integrase [Lautropia sp.]
MSSPVIELIADRLPRVTAKDVHRFTDSVEIRDARAFSAELQAFIHECLESVRFSANQEVETVEQTLARKAQALSADSAWVPSQTDIQRGRTVLLDAFQQPSNLPIPAFAKLAGKSRQQIYKDISARRLLTLSVGPRGQRLPDWQLDPVKRQLTETVLHQTAEDIDNWTLYRAMSEPLEGLGGRSPVDAVTNSSIDQVVLAVLNVLGIQAD